MSLTTASERGFLEMNRHAPTSEEDWHEEYQDWHEECKRQKRPCVCVEGGKTQKARFSLVMETTDHDLSFSAWVELSLLIGRYTVGTASVSPDGAYFQDTAGCSDVSEVTGHLLRLASDSITLCETGDTLCLRHAGEKL